MSGDDSHLKQQSRVNVSRNRCPYCHDDVVAEDPQGRHHCHACGALHHESCIREAKGKCAGCFAENKVFSQAQEEDASEDSDTSKCRDCGGRMGAVSTGCMECGKWFHQGCGWGHECKPRPPKPMTESEIEELADDVKKTQQKVDKINLNMSLHRVNRDEVFRYTSLLFGFALLCTCGVLITKAFQFLPVLYMFFGLTGAGAYLTIVQHFRFEKAAKELKYETSYLDLLITTQQEEAQAQEEDRSVEH